MKVVHMFMSRLLTILICALPVSVAAHEFWIEPETYQVEPGERLQAVFKNGQEFEGSSLSFFERSSARFEMYADGQVMALTPRSGDSPALDVDAPVTDGLVSVVHETT
jgi:cobalt/nickel transport protein